VILDCLNVIFLVMSLLNQHDPEHPDALMRPMQSTRSKLRRALWNATWLILCRPTPNPMHRWRCAVLRLFGAKLGKNNFIYPSARIWAPWLLETGDVATIAQQVYVYNVGLMIFSTPIFLWFPSL
jgi:putative colanic acid biosynthesis acetyltransferase WcaF